MYLKKVLNQPNLVGTVMIVLLFGAGFVYAFAFDGFNVETATQGDVEAWLAAAGGGNNDYDDPDPCDCMTARMNDADDCSTDLCDTNDSDYPCGDDIAYCSKDCPHKGEGGCSTCGGDWKCGNTGSLCEDTEKCKPPNKPIEDDTRNGDGGMS